MKQISYELKKSILSKSSVVIIIALLCFNAILSFYFANQVPKSEQTQNYESIITSVIKNSTKQLKQIAIKEPNSYSAKYHEDVVRIYSELKPLELAQKPVNGWDTYLKFNAINPLILICIVFIAIKIFSTDIVSGFQPIIYATTNGRTKYILIKILEIVIVSVILNILSFVTTFLSMTLVCSFSGFNEYIQSFATFKAAPYAMRVWEAVLLLFGLRTVITLSLSALVGVIFYLSKSRLLTLISTVLIYGVNFMLNNLTYLNNDTIFENGNIISAMDITTILSKYQCVRIFGNPIPSTNVLFVLYLILFFLFATTVILLYNRFIHLGVKVGLRFKYHSHKVKSHDKTLIGWELAKVIKNRIVVSVMVLLILVSAVSAVVQYTKNKADKVFYDYIQQLKLISIDEREIYIKSEQDRINKAYEEYLAYRTALSQQVEYEGDAENVEKEYYYALLHEEPLRKAAAMCKYIEEHGSSKDLTLIYDTGWMKLFETGDSLPLFLLIVLLATFSASIEFSSKFATILNTTPSGRKNTNISKLIVCISLTTGLFIIFTLLQILPILSGYSIEDLTARLTSLQIYQNAPQNIQLWQYFALVILIRYISCILICILSCQIARLIKISYLSMIIITVFVQLPALVYSMGIEMLKYCRYTTFLDGNQFMLLGMDNGYLKSSFIFIFFLTISVVLSIITASRLKGKSV